VVIKGYDHDGAVQLCYDGEAFRQVLRMRTSTAEQRARATLALTRADCMATELSPPARLDADLQRAELLERLDLMALPDTLKNRVQLRRASVWATLAYEQSRRSGAAPAQVQQAGTQALQALAAVNKTELADDDQTDYAIAAIRTGASRWSALAPAATTAATTSALTVQAVPGEPGQTCVQLSEQKSPASAPLLRRCTWGTVWLASASVSPNGQAVALAVQPMAGWRELWVLRRTADGWTADALPPAAGTPLSGDVGYIEFAGWVPGGERLLIAREASVDGRIKRSFEVLRLDSLATEKQASTPALLVLFSKWQDAAWKATTVSLR